MGGDISRKAAKPQRRRGAKEVGCETLHGAAVTLLRPRGRRGRCPRRCAAPARACPTCRVSCAPSSRRSGPRPPAACTWRIGTETDGEGRDKAQRVPARPAPRVTDGPGAKRTGRRAGEEQGRVSAPGREALKYTREARVTSGRSGPASTRALGTAFAAWRLCERTYHPFRCLQ
jgi:hypothetical protein